MIHLRKHRRVFTLLSSSKYVRLFSLFCFVLFSKSRSSSSFQSTFNKIFLTATIHVTSRGRKNSATCSMPVLQCPVQRSHAVIKQAFLNSLSKQYLQHISLDFFTNIVVQKQFYTLPICQYNPRYFLPKEECCNMVHVPSLLHSTKESDPE